MAITLHKLTNEEAINTGFTYVAKVPYSDITGVSVKTLYTAELGDLFCYPLAAVYVKTAYSAGTMTGIVGDDNAVADTFVATGVVSTAFAGLPVGTLVAPLPVTTATVTTPVAATAGRKIALQCTAFTAGGNTTGELWVYLNVRKFNQLAAKATL